MTKRSAITAILLALSTGNLNIAAHATRTQQPARGFVEELRIVSDERNPAMALTMPNDLIVSEAGLLFTSHETEGLIRVFDARGRYLRSIGRRGQGPGEFARAFTLFATVADTLIAYDLNGWALVFFRDDGTHLRTIPIDSIGSSRRRPLAVAYLGNNRVFSKIEYYGAQGSANLSDSTVYLLTETSGRVVTRLGVLGPVPSSSPAGAGWQPATAARAAESRVMALFAMRPRFLEDNFGRRGLMLQPHTVFGGSADQFRLVAVTRDGIASQRVYTMPAVQFGASDREELVKLVLMSIAYTDSISASRARGRFSSLPPRGETEAQVRAAVSRMGVPPAVQHAIAGADGSLWIMSLRHRQVWTVFNPAGAVAYTVRLPLEARVMRVTQDRFWAVTADGNGLPIITRNRVVAR
jgi:hypothetical protein